MENKLATYSLKYSKRVLSLLDKGEYKPTYGCFDRNYWHYKTVTDFPSSIFQQLTLYIAHLYGTNLTGNCYYKQKELLELCLSGINFWVKIQNKDGSFNEWYPNEHSHVATAFTLYGITESLLIIRNELDKKTLESFYEPILKACRWLAKNPDKIVLNHTAGALMSFYNACLLTSENELMQYIDDQIQILKENQSQEGWFSEYYGADIGYTSVSIDYLAKYYDKSGDERAYHMLEKAISFLAFFMHPDGSSGGEYGNRNTKYVMPAGIHILSKYFDEARYILDKFYYGLEKGTQIDLETIDDRYFAFFFATNYLEAAIQFEKLEPENFQYNKNKYKYFSQIFPQAGIIVKNTPRYYFVCNFRKGGVIKLFSQDGRLLYADSSYYVKFKNQKLSSSQKLSTKLEYYIDNSSEYDIEIKFESPFIWVNTSLPLTKILIPFRIFNYTFGYINALMNLFNKNLKKFMIVEPKPAPLKVKRNISIKNNKLKIDDAVSKSTKLEVESINLPSAKANLHVPSSRYALNYDTKEFLGIDPVCVKEINTVNVTCISTQIEITGDTKENESSSNNSTQQAQ
jgi:hypothetical protein